VPFRGTPEALTEIITGRVDYYSARSIAVLPMITEKRCSRSPWEARSVGSSAGRADDARGRYSKLGLQFLGRHVRAIKDAREIVNRLHQEIAKALETKTCATAWPSSAPSRC